MPTAGISSSTKGACRTASLSAPLRRPQLKFNCSTVLTKVLRMKLRAGSETREKRRRTYQNRLARGAAIVAIVAAIAVCLPAISSHTRLPLAAAAPDFAVSPSVSYPVQIRLALLTGQQTLLQPDLTWSQLQTLVGNVATDGAMVDPSSGQPWDIPTLLHHDLFARRDWLPETAPAADLIEQLDGAVNLLTWRLAHPTPADDGTSVGYGYNGTSGLDFEGVGRGLSLQTNAICTQDGSGAYQPQPRLVATWKILYKRALSEENPSDGSLIGVGSNAYETGGAAGNFAQVNVERALYQGQLPAPGGLFGPIDGFRVDRAMAVLSPLQPDQLAGSNGYSARKLRLEAAVTGVRAHSAMTNADFILPATKEQVRLTYVPASSGYWRAAFNLPLAHLLLHSTSNPLHPVFAPALRAEILAQEPPPGFPDSVPPFLSLRLGGAVVTGQRCRFHLPSGSAAGRSHHGPATRAHPKSRLTQSYERSNSATS